MNWIDLVIVGGCWLLIPAAIVAKLVMDKRQAKSERKTWAEVDRILSGKGGPTHD